MYEPKRNTDFVPPITDFSARYDEASVDAHSNLREVICGIIASVIAVPIIYIAFCAVMSLGDIF